MKMLRLTGTVNVEAAATDGGPPKFAMLAYTGVAMRVGGFHAPVVVDVAGVKAAAGMPILRDHDAMRVVGHTTAVNLSKDTGEILLAGVVSGAGADAAEVVQASKNGFQWQSSIGAESHKTEFVETGAKVRVNGKTLTGPLIVIRSSTLRETSFVAIGADGATSATVAAKRQSEGGKMEFAEYVADLGFDDATLTDSQRNALKAGHAATLSPSEPKKKTAREELLSHTRDVRAMVANYCGSSPHAADEFNVIGRQGIEHGWDIEEVENKLMLAELRASRAGGACNINTHNNGRNSGGSMTSVLEASLLMQQNVSAKFIEAQYGQRVVDAATGKDFRGLGLHALCRMSLQSRGVSTGPGRLSEFQLREALDVRASGPSTLSVPGVLSNVMNKSMLSAFTLTPTTFGKFSRTSSVNDFKTATAFRLTMAGEIEEIAPGGELKHATMSEGDFTRRAHQYGKLLGLDRVTIVNDDMSALQSVPSHLARMAAMTLERKAYTTLLGNADDFFGSGNGNNLTGAGSVLADAGLTTAWKTMSELKDTDGRPVLITPSILLVCPALWRTARSLTNSTGTNATTTANVPLPDGNPWNGLLEIVQSPYLGLSQAITNGSDTLWYLTTGSGEFSILDVCYLDGRQTPTVESFDMPVDRLGLVFRIVFDFGVSLFEPKGGVRNAGA